MIVYNALGFVIFILEQLGIRAESYDSSPTPDDEVGRFPARFMTVSDMGWTRGCESASSFMRLPPHEPTLCEILRWLAAEILRYSMPINKLRGNKQSKHCQATFVSSFQKGRVLAQDAMGPASFALAGRGVMNSLPTLSVA